MKKILSLISILVLSLVATVARAQDTGVNSPLSRYGMGLLSRQAQGFNQGMAGVGYGMRDGRDLNYKNPASYSAIDSLAFIFDIGMSLQNGNFNSGTSAINAKNVSFDYMTMGFRLHPGVGMTLGVMPISSVGYKVAGVQSAVIENGITGNITSLSNYNGNGGLHVAYGGVGYAPFRQLSLGLNAGFVWGNLNHVVTTSYSDSYTPASSRIYSSSIRSYKLDAALQWQQKIGKNDWLTLGTNYGLGHDLGGKSLLVTGTVTTLDTISVKKAWSLPHTIGMGASWNHNNQLRLGADYDYQRWSHAKQPAMSPDGKDYVASSAGYADSHRISVGAEYVKDPQGLSWASRVRYRAGFSYGSSYMKIGGQNGPRNYLATAGVALPIINLYNNRTFVNVAVQYERVQPSVSGQLTENYIRLCLGISFNERWFMKWKVE